MHQKIKLVSKRNQVFRIINDDNTIISKTFENINDIKNEFEILKLLINQGCNVPDIIAINHNTLCLEDLGNVTLLDWYENIEKENSSNYSNIICELINWLKNFYESTSSYYKEQYILSDVNFRNFLIKDDTIFGIDFEKSQPGKIEVDVGKLSAYALTYDPPMTEWKINFTRQLVYNLSSSLNLSLENVLTEQKKEIENIKKRRKKI